MKLPVPQGLPRVVDGTWMTCVLECIRRAYLRHVMNLVPIDYDPSLNCGSAAHEIIHRWYAGDPGPDGKPTVEPESFEAYLAAVDWLEENYNPPPGDHRTPEFVTYMFKEYIVTHAKGVRKYEVLKSEQGFILPIGDIRGTDGRLIEVMYGGRMDRVIRWEDGFLYGCDLKTGKSIGSYWAKQWRPHLPFTGYTWALEQLKGEVCLGMCVEGLSTAKNPEHRQYDHWTNRTPLEIDEFKRTVMGTCKRWIGLCREVEAGANPLQVFCQSPTACHKYSGCAYKDLCIGGVEQANIDGMFEESPWVPFELEEGTGNE